MQASVSESPLINIIHTGCIRTITANTDERLKKEISLSVALVAEVEARKQLFWWTQSVNMGIINNGKKMLERHHEADTVNAAASEGR